MHNFVFMCVCVCVCVCVFISYFAQCTSNKNFVLDVGMEKEQKQELQWRISVLPIPAFHCQARRNRSGRSGQDPTKNQGFFCGINLHMTWALNLTGLLSRKQ